MYKTTRRTTTLQKHRCEILRSNTVQTCYWNDIWMTISVFWNVTQCNLAEAWRPFREFCCLHHQGTTSNVDIVTSQKTVNFTVSVSKTANLVDQFNFYLVAGIVPSDDKYFFHKWVLWLYLFLCGKGKVKFTICNIAINIFVINLLR
jgi:hypothetical protein